MTIAIVPATFAHAEELAENLRPGDAMEIAALGFTPLEALDAALCHSLRAEAVLVVNGQGRGQVAALRGYAAPALLGDTADLWCFTSPLCDARKKSVMKQSRAFVDELQGKFARLRALVALDYAQAVRWLGWLGFAPGEIESHGGRQFMRVTRCATASAPPRYSNRQIEQECEHGC